MVEGSRVRRRRIECVEGMRDIFRQIKSWRSGLWLAALLMAAGLGASAPARAQGNFVVADVPIEATAASSTLARERAIAQGNEVALRRLMERMTRRSDWSFLPKSTAADLIESFELKNEQVGPIRYAAAMTVRFRPGPVRELLRRNNIGFTEATAAKPVLVLPVYEWAGVKTLWEDNNPWRAAWARRKGDTLVPLLVPQGDLSDRAALTADQAAAGDAGRITAIARRYNVPGAAVVRANHFVDARNGRPVIELTIARFGDGAAAAGPVERVVGNANEPIEQLTDRAVAQTVVLMDEGFKATTVISGDQTEETLVASVPLTGIAQMVKIRRDIASLAVVKREELVVLGRKEMQLRIAYVGGVERLRATLAQSDLTLEQQGAAWTLRPGSATPR